MVNFRGGGENRSRGGFFPGGPETRIPAGIQDSWPGLPRGKTAGFGRFRGENRWGFSPARGAENPAAPQDHLIICKIGGDLPGWPNRTRFRIPKFQAREGIPARGEVLAGNRWDQEIQLRTAFPGPGENPPWDGFPAPQDDSWLPRIPDPRPKPLPGELFPHGLFIAIGALPGRQ